MESFYVYVYLNPTKPGDFSYGLYSFKYEPFYIGKGSNDRLYHHLNEAKNNKLGKNPHKFYFIRKLLLNNVEPIILKYKDDLSEQDALLLEREMISAIGRRDYDTGPLLNAIEGGIGGLKPSPDMKKRRSVWSSGEGNPFYNKKHSDRTRQLISENRSGVQAWNKGISFLSNDARSKISAANKGRLTGDKNPSKRDDVKDKISSANSGENNGNAKKWKVIFENGSEIVFYGGIKRFCKEHNLDFKKLRKNKYANITLICLDDLSDSI